MSSDLDVKPSELLSSEHAILVDVLPQHHVELLKHQYTAQAEMRNQMYVQVLL